MGRDVTNAEITELRVKRPDGTEVIWPAEKSTFNKNSIRYVTVTGDLTQSGLYEMQSRIKIAGFEGLGETAGFVVYDKFA